MSIKTIEQNAKITDTIRFLIETPDVDDCLSSDPYKVDTIKIYYVERNFLGNNYGEYTKTKLDEGILETLKIARDVACADPTEKNILEVARIQDELTSKAQTNIFYYTDAVLVAEIGTSDVPVWLSTDVDNASIEQVEEDEEGNTIYGTFTYDWTPKSKVREGDFFLCWTWTPNVSGDSLSAHLPFTLWGDGKAVQSIPTHVTPDDKYDTLLERYLPEMYKTALTNKDITPEVTDKLNRSIATGFTFIENYANQVIDLYDSNVLHESLLVYLSNLFNLKLKSDDPTLWRRQIKEAVPLFKRKGTLGGLEDAFAQSGMSLEKFTELWQVVSPYTWQQSFLVKDSPTFKLDKPPLSDVNDTNFAVWIRREDEDEYVQLTNDMVEFTEVDCDFYVTWVGDEKSANQVILYEGDILRVLYQYAEIPSGSQSIEDFIRSLPLADSRDELLAEYPSKNWNVRLIEEDDPLFDVVVPVRHPFHDNVIFGQIRTEFPYSENIYNMEEYNGSTRDSYDACFIDNAFRDPCGSCLSSKYNIDIGIEGLSDDRLVEVYDILSEYTPFTSVPHRINFIGEVSDYISPPVQQVDFLVQYNLFEYVLSGEYNPFFHRVMEDGLTDWVVDREDLANQITEVTSQTGTAYNSGVSIIAPNVNLERLGLIIDNHILEILSPSPNSGTYFLSEVDGNTGVISSSVVEPINTDGFTFKLSNVVYENLNGTITQETCATLSDSSNALSNYPIKTIWDMEFTPDYTGDAWKVRFPTLSLILEVERTEGDLIYFSCDSTIPAGDYSFILLDDDDNEILSSTTGTVSTLSRGRVSVSDPHVSDITEIVRHGDYFLYDGEEYLVDELKIDGDIVINDYSDGDASGVTMQFLRRLVFSETGYFAYHGLKLTTSVDHESGLGIQNGLSSPVTDENLLLDNSKFKEHYLVQIGSDYYKIAEINGTDITLAGLPQDWGTMIAGGSLVEYGIFHFENSTVETQFMVFDQLDRRGKDPVVREIELSSDIAIVALSINPQSGQGIEDSSAQEESISFHVEYKDGNTEQGEI